MKAGLVYASTACIALWTGCQFERGPLIAKHDQEHDAQQSEVTADAAAFDASTRDASMDSGSDTGVFPVVDAGLNSTPDAYIEDDSSVTNPVTDPTQAPHDPPPPPMSGGLQCNGVFCSFAVDPAKLCCTAQADVDQHTARAVDRCGLDLRDVSSQAYGTACWQRDQLGIVDATCPGLEDESAASSEPGCCGDDGMCGSVNSSEKLGCRHALGSKVQACGAESSNTCDPLGSFGVRISVDAAWGGRSGGLVGLTDDGRGEISVYLLIVIDSVDSATHAIKTHGRVCGVTLPPFYSSTLCESYAPQFPVKMWESSAIPRLMLTGRYDCMGPGCVLSLDPETYLLGFSLANPEAPWPTADETSTLMCPLGRGANCFPDHDMDGQPGVGVTLLNTGKAPAAANCVNGYQYRGAPLSASIAAIFDGVRRADRLQLGVRIKLGASMRLSENCNAAQGNGIAEYVNSRSPGCTVQQGTYDFPNVRNLAGPNDPCTATEAQFLDANLPVYNLLTPGTIPDSALKLADKSPSNGPVSSLVRLGTTTDDVGCAAVRDAAYDPAPSQPSQLQH